MTIRNSGLVDFFASYKDTVVSAVLFLAFICWAHPGHAAFLNLNGLGGNIGYNYVFVDSLGGQFETSTWMLNLNGDAIFVEPWIASGSANVTFGFVQSNYSDGDQRASENQALNTNFTLSVFPLSRFPLVISYGQNDSRLLYGGETSATASTHFQSRFLNINQLYVTESGIVYRFGYGNTTSITEEGENNNKNYTAEMSLRREHHDLNLTYWRNEGESQQTNAEYSLVNDTLFATHSYQPTSELGLNTVLSKVRNQAIYNTTSTSDSAQISTMASWSPSYRPFGFSGGVRFSESTNDNALSTGSTSTDRRSMGMNGSVRYRMSRKMSLSASVNTNVNDNNQSQSITTVENVSASYAPDSIVLLGMNGSVFLGAGVSNSESALTNSEGDDEVTSVQSGTGSIGGTLARSWNMFQRGRIDLSFNAAGSAGQTSDKDYITRGMSDGLQLGVYHGGISGNTNLSVNLSDSRTWDEDFFNRRLLSVNLSRSQTLSRLSEVFISLNYQLSQFSQEELAWDWNGSKSGGGDIDFTHYRLLGIYGLQFRSNYNVRISEGATDGTVFRSDRWTNNLDYAIGLLKLGAGYNTIITDNGSRSQSFNFSASRSF